MRPLLLGAGGLVGRHMRDALQQEDLVATTRDGLDGTVLADVRDEAAMRRLVRDVRPNVIINAAAEAHVERCEAEPEVTRAVNVAPIHVLAELAAESGATLVVFSSEYVFDGTHGPYSEEDAVAPINEYGRQKVELEVTVRSTRHLICRTSGVFGVEPRRRNFVLQLVDRLRAGQSFVVPADQQITPTYAPSLAEAVVDLLRRGQTGTFHVAGPEIFERTTFALLVADTFGLPRAMVMGRPTQELGLSARRPRKAGLLDRKIRDALGHGLAPAAAGLRQMAASA